MSSPSPSPNGSLPPIHEGDENGTHVPEHSNSNQDAPMDVSDHTLDAKTTMRHGNPADAAAVSEPPPSTASVTASNGNMQNDKPSEKTQPDSASRSRSRSRSLRKSSTTSSSSHRRRSHSRSPSHSDPRSRSRSQSRSKSRSSRHHRRSRSRSRSRSHNRRKHKSGKRKKRERSRSPSASSSRSRSRSRSRSHKRSKRHGKSRSRSRSPSSSSSPPSRSSPSSSRSRPRSRSRDRRRKRKDRGWEKEKKERRKRDKREKEKEKKRKDDRKKEKEKEKQRSKDDKSKELAASSKTPAASEGSDSEYWSDSSRGRHRGKDGGVIPARSFSNTSAANLIGKVQLLVRNSFGLIEKTLITPPPNASPELMPKKGQTVTVYATGRIQAGGKQFWSTRDKYGERPFSWVVGSGSQPEGFDRAIRSMYKGETSSFVVTSNFAYGVKGEARLNVPGSATIEVTFKLIKIEETPEKQ